MYHSKLLLVAFSAALLAACGTKVPITEHAPVVERTPQPIAPISSTPSTTSTSPSANPSLAPRTIAPVVVAPPQVLKSGIVYFDFDSYAIKPEYQALLEAQAKFLAGNKTAKVSLAGHTDDLGGREYNLALGQKRADAVKRALGILGVSEPQMEAVSFGKEKPASTATDDQARAKNRRVELSAP